LAGAEVPVKVRSQADHVRACWRYWSPSWSICWSP